MKKLLQHTSAGFQRASAVIRMLKSKHGKSSLWGALLGMLIVCAGLSEKRLSWALTLVTVCAVLVFAFRGPLSTSNERWAATMLWIVLVTSIVSLFSPVDVRLHHGMNLSVTFPMVVYEHGRLREVRALEASGLKQGSDFVVEERPGLFNRLQRTVLITMP